MHLLVESKKIKNDFYLTIIYLHQPMTPHKAQI